VAKPMNNPFKRVMAFARLSNSQRRTLEDLNDAIASMQRWHGQPYDELKEDELFQVAHRDYEKMMVRAIRAGLTEHPTVQEFIHVRRSIGSRKILRQARSGVEKGTVHQWVLEDVRLRHEIIQLIGDYEEKYNKPLTQSRARQLLLVQNKLPRMTRQGFHKLLKRLNLLMYFRR
jgi:hypothetical protein